MFRCFHILILSGLLFLFKINPLSGQIVWSEDFNSYPDGTTVGTAGKWSTGGCPTCLAGDWFEVRSGEMEALDVNNWVFWITESIDISSCTDIQFSMDANESGDLEGAGCGCGINIDYFDVYYSIDGGAFTVIEDWNGDGEAGHTLSGDSLMGVYDDNDWVSTNVNLCVTGGTSLVLRVEIRNTAGTESIRIDNVVVSCGSCSLPVELFDFNAFQEEEAIRLFWETASEYDSDFFQPEKSRDGVNFSPIGEVGAMGNSSLPKEYSFIDHNPNSGSNWYRLGMVDRNGSIRYSKTVQADFHPSQPNLFRVYPNPANDFLNVDFTSGPNQPGQLELIEGHLDLLDVNGRLVLDGKALHESGNTRISLSDIPKGIYVLRLSLPDRQRFRRIVVE